MKTTVKGAVDIEGIKRCYVKAKLEIKCPNCYSILIADLGENYLSHPEVPGEDTAYFYCKRCESKDRDCEFTIPIYIEACEMTITYDPYVIKTE